MDVMELMFAEWEDGERFSFEDSDRFEEDSLCSFISEAESLCQNWRGWRKQSAGPNSPTVKIKGLRRMYTYTYSYTHFESVFTEIKAVGVVFSTLNGLAVFKFSITYFFKTYLH